MTTIVIDYLNSTVAVDRMMTTSVGAIDRTSSTTKFYMHGNTLITGCGNKDSVDEFIEAYVKDDLPLHKDTYDSSRIMTVTTVEGVLHLCVYELNPTPVKDGWFSKPYYVYDRMYSKRDEGFVTYGSGQDYAYAALHLRYSAENAARIAAECSTGTGLGIDVFHWNNDVLRHDHAKDASLKRK